jgi:hypothetical protein
MNDLEKLQEGYDIISKNLKQLDMLSISIISESSFRPKISIKYPECYVYYNINDFLLFVKEVKSKFRKQKLKYVLDDK